MIDASAARDISDKVVAMQRDQNFDIFKKEVEQRVRDVASLGGCMAIVDWHDPFEDRFDEYLTSLGFEYEKGPNEIIVRW